MVSAKSILMELLNKNDVTINGSGKYNINVYNEAVYARILKHGSLGVGESYMAKWWDAESLTNVLCKLLETDFQNQLKNDWQMILRIMAQRLFNFQSKKRAHIVAHKHYDIGNDLYERMLDTHMQYSCAYWKNSSNLNDAAIAKMELICKKLKLEEGMTVVDIGCGWGGLAYYMAKNYKVKVMGVTISQEQYKVARQRCSGLDVQILMQDYRDLNCGANRVVSVGMFEHVGHKNYGTFMQVTSNILAQDGLMLLHTIGSSASSFAGDPWIEKYIFPNGMLPSLMQLSQVINKYFIMEDWHNFGADYDKTLMSWYQNFKDNWDNLKHNYSEEFYRMWEFYLSVCAALFRSRKIHLWQIVLSKNGLVGGYQSVR